MHLYLALRLLKFCGVALLAGGSASALLAPDARSRQRAVHRVASPGLVLTWLAGYLLTVKLGVSLGEPWILGGLALSFAAQLGLLHVATHGVSRASAAAVLLPLFATLVLMVFRPSWAGLWP